MYSSVSIPGPGIISVLVVRVGEFLLVGVDDDPEEANETQPDERGDEVFKVYSAEHGGGDDDEDQPEDQDEG